MPKTTPQYSPMHYLRIEQASYASDSAGFLQRYVPKTQLLAEESVAGWKFILVKDEVSGELAVAFKGTEPKSLRNWVGNIWHQILTPHDEFSKMQTIIDGWEGLHGRVTVLLGHSAGSLFATHLNDHDRLVITFNGQKAERGPNRINLALSGDPLTQTKFLSVPSRYILVDGEQGPRSLKAHCLDTFEPYLAGKKWTDLSKKFKELESAQQPVLPGPSEAMSRLILAYQKQANEALSLAGRDFESIPDNLSVDRIQGALDRHSAEGLISKMEQSLASAQGFQEEMNSQWKRAVRTKKTATGTEQTLIPLKCAEQMALAMYRDQQQSLVNTQNRLQMRGWETVVKKYAARLHEMHHTQHVDLSLPQMQSVALHAIHPQGSISQRLQEIRQFITEYKKTQQTLQSLLEERRSRQQLLDGVESNLDRLDHDIKKHYRSLLKSQEKIGGILQKTGTALSIASAALAFVPGGQPISAAMSVAAVTAGIGNTIIGKKTAKMGDRYQRALGRNGDIREQLAQIASRNFQEMASVYREQTQQRAILMAAADHSVPCEYREALDTAYEELQDQIGSQKKSIDSKQAKIEAKKREISQLEKTEKERQKALDDTKKSDKGGKERRKNRLLKTQEALAQANTDLYSLQQEMSAEQSILDGLEKDEENLRGLREQEYKLAPIKDFFYAAVSDEAKKWEALDEDTRKWREAVEKGLKDFDLARESERRLVYGALTAMGNLCSELEKSALNLNALNLEWGVRQIQTTVGFGEQLYRLHDLLKTWKKANESLDITLEELQKENPDATINDAIKKMGAFFYVSQYVVPGLQMITVGLAAFRLGYHLFNGSPRIEPEKRMLRQLGEFLHKFSDHVDEQFKNLHSRLGQDHKELLDTLTLVRLEMVVLSQEVMREVKNSREIIISELHLDTYNNHTTQVRKKSRDISRAYAEFLDKSEEEQRGLLHGFLKGIKHDLEFETTFEGHNGTILTRGDSGAQDALRPLVQVRLMAQNPDIYTGLLALKLGANATTKTPSLHLLLPLLDNYQAVLRRAQLLGVNIEDGVQQEITSMFQSQALSILDLSARLEEVIDFVRQRQDTVIEELRTNRESAQQMKQEYFLKCIQVAVERQTELLNRLTHPDQLVAGKKFHYGDLILKQTFEVPDPVIDRGAVMTGAMLGGSYLAMGLTVAGGVLTAGVGTFAAVGLVAGCFMGKDDQEKTVKAHELAIGLKNKTIKDITLRRRNAVETLSNTCSLLTEIWMNEQGKLASNIVGYWKHSDQYYGDRVGKRKEPNAKSPFHTRLWVHRYYSYAEERDEYKSLIKLNELSKLESGIHTSPPEYTDNLRKLIQDYKSYLLGVQSGHLPDSENCFSRVHDNAQLVPCKDLKFVPLAFPKKLIDSLYAQLRNELDQMEVTGVGTLIPFYELKECSHTGSQIIKIVFDFVEKGQWDERTPYAEFTVAEIDGATVKVFAAPTFDKEQEANQPCLNEMLLQAMYTRLYPSIGMPGDQSVPLGDGNGLAPAERAFPGFFALWEKEPTKAIHFVLSDYSSNCADEAERIVANDPCLDGEIYRTMLRERNSPVLTAKYLEIFKKARVGKAKLDEAKQELKENYQLLWAYCCFISGLDNATLRTSIERDLGILDPACYDSISDQIIWRLNPGPITEEGIGWFENFLEYVPNRSLSELERLMRALPI